MKIAFYKARYGRWIDWVIAAGTLSKYSHCELILDSGMSVSSSPRDGGVRVKYIEYDPEKWDIFDLNYHDPVAKQYISFWFAQNKNDKYDILGAIGSAFRLDLTSEDRKFCSYCCAVVLGLNPIISPGRLLKLLKKEKLI